MQSVHEILTAGADGTEHTALQGLMNDLLPARSQTNVIILDELARRQALQKKLERQRQHLLFSVKYSSLPTTISFPYGCLRVNVT